jgi:ubiquinone/menaquinone biosynthesis C-methylase UbiE
MLIEILQHATEFSTPHLTLDLDPCILKIKLKRCSKEETNMTAFEQERKKIGEKILSLLELRPDEKILDVGVGRTAYSLKKLIELGAPVTAIDIDWQVLHQHKTSEASAIQCNAAYIPIRNTAFHIALANFTFHEINPVLHRQVVSELCRVSHKVVIVEPAFADDPLCRRFQEIWTESMHSINQFEDYQSMASWTNLLKGCGARVTVTETFPSRVRLCGEEAREYMKTTVEELYAEGVSDKHINNMQSLEKDVVENGMVFSDVIVIIADA